MVKIIIDAETRIRYREARRNRQENEARIAALKRRYAERFPGWKLSRANPCLREVIGQRCRRYSMRSFYGERCVCDKLGFPIMDHLHLWNTPEGRVLTTEPYGVNPEAFRCLTEQCSAMGLVATIEEGSPWVPGGTTLIVIRRADPSR